ncbi:phospholipid-transporting ATPase [Nematocida sp. AWRm77]|nr:phospholipid-transporting ATPase [Nematocida sp. AWRm77]
MNRVVPPKLFKKKTNSVKSTRHTWKTFVPMRLLKEMTKSFNLFFVFLCCIVLIPNLTPFSGLSYIVCVAMVLSINIMKAALSEFKRYQADKETNSQPFTAVRKGTVVSISRENINLGEYLILPHGVLFPVDVLVLGVCTPHGGRGQVYIETSSLNGESALKIRKPVLPLLSSSDFSEADLSVLGHITAAEINEDTLQGTLHLEDGAEHGFKEESVVLKGCSIYGTSSIVGMSLGGKNSAGVYRIKNSLFMKMLSHTTLILILVYMLILCAASASSCSFIAHSSWMASLYPGVPLSFLAVKNFVSNILIFSSLVPLSLFVTLDGLRIAYSVYIQADREMAKDNQYCENNTHGTVEDIGLLTHVLTDKTGTLTQNQMMFKGMHIRGGSAPLFFEGATLESLLSQDYGLVVVLALLLCQSVEVVEEEYRGVSQEEISILNLLKALGAVVLSREEPFLTLRIGEHTFTARIAGTMPFSPGLSRMGVLAQIGNMNFLFLKGSDEKVSCEGALEVDGKYRALTVAVRVLTEKEVKACSEDSSTDVSICKSLSLAQLVPAPSCSDRTDRSDKSDRTDRSDRALPAVPLPPESIQKLEKSAVYMGTTYIEDMLQENVAVSIDRIKQKGIHVWMITGDRKESALSCSAQTNILTAQSSVLSGREAVQALQQKDTPLARKLVCEPGVIVYRASPEDKKEIAHLLRKEGAIVLGVGDGENDVGMIEEADIGVCVLGKEGKKAAFVSDIIIPTFSSVSRLITYHGTGCLERLKSVYFFYVFKSMASAVCQLLYGMCVGSSGSIASSSLFLLLYNSLITSPLSLEIGLFQTKSTVQTVFESLWTGLLYGVASFFVVYKSFSSIDAIDALGNTAGHALVGRIFSLCIFLSTMIHFLFVSDSFVAVSPISIGLSIVFFLVSLGMDGGFDIFTCPSLYLIAVFMLSSGIAIERLGALFRRKRPQSGNTFRSLLGRP